MLVLHLLKTNQGAEWAQLQMQRLCDRGVDVHVAIPSGDTSSEYTKGGATVHDLGARVDLHGARAAADRLRNIVAEVKPDLIHSHFMQTTLLARLALGRRHATPRLFQVPGPLHLEFAPTRLADVYSAGPRDYWAPACRFSVQRYADSGVSESRLFLAHYGMDTDSFRPGSRGLLRQQLGLPNETRLVGMVAYIYAPRWYMRQRRGIKGHEDLIDAMSRVAERVDNVHCVIAGSAWNGAKAYEQQVRAYARTRAHGLVSFLGHRDDIASLYDEFDVAVHPSHSENLGGAVESLAKEIPTITTDVGGFPDIVSDGENGRLVPAKDPAALAEAIVDELNHPQRARRMASTGRRRVVELLSMASTTDRMLQIYQSILESMVPASCLTLES
jgi:glycosyltransferase involved in cell wall biosynthesis